MCIPGYLIAHCSSIGFLPLSLGKMQNVTCERIVGLNYPHIIFMDNNESKENNRRIYASRELRFASCCERVSIVMNQTNFYAKYFSLHREYECMCVGSGTRNTCQSFNH